MMDRMDVMVDEYMEESYNVYEARQQRRLWETCDL